MELYGTISTKVDISDEELINSLKRRFKTEWYWLKGNKLLIYDEHRDEYFPIRITEKTTSYQKERFEKIKNALKVINALENLLNGT